MKFTYRIVRYRQFKKVGRSSNANAIGFHMCVSGRVWVPQQNAYLHGNGVEFYHVGKISSKHHINVRNTHRARVKYTHQNNISFYVLCKTQTGSFVFKCYWYCSAHTHTPYLYPCQANNIPLLPAFSHFLPFVEFNLNPKSLSLSLETKTMQAVLMDYVLDFQSEEEINRLKRL